MSPFARTLPLPPSGPWPTRDPFLFCVHHVDDYPPGDGRFGPAASLAGRDIGQDFSGLNGWSMYHGRSVPGFPSHPHRGFETVTVVENGLIDHADSLGAAARYGNGDVQWLTAGRGIVHAEMFPLLNADAGNPARFFQIWLNLSAAQKMAEPFFKMFWADSVPLLETMDAEGRKRRIRVVAGALGDAVPPSPPPSSWAALADSHVAIWTIELEAGAHWTLPEVPEGVGRMLYTVEGSGLAASTTSLAPRTANLLASEAELPLVNGPATSSLLLLQGRSIGEPVARRGPFVMNSAAEIQQAYLDYSRTRFGGWPWGESDPVHGPEPLRFARRQDGTVERPHHQEKPG